MQDPSDVAKAAWNAATSWARQVARRPRRLAPWDEMPYFDLPVCHSFNFVPGPTIQILNANPMRIAIIFGCLNGGPIQVSPSRTFNDGTGFFVSASQLPVTLLQRDFGPLTQVAWWSPASAGNLTVIEIILSKWENPP